MTEQGSGVPKKFHWVEGRYLRDDSTVFTRRFYIPAAQVCPPTTEDDSGMKGRLIEGSCIEVNKECFIATAAFGSELDSRVQFLRSFRDDVLLQSGLRVPFAEVLGVYYRFSPPVAGAMTRHRAAKLVLKWVVAYPTILFVRGFVALLRITHPDWRRQTRHAR
ncbi:MAG: hypothetical protein JRN27_03260 [Nitrososphaerota archaeon]|nr:hypothetical protein [Nitrososphaerota archaeon]MDG6975099.1 hypothetical protein [Nitrososphaerota archaeon]